MSSPVELDLAQERVDEAYQRARRLVFDLYPTGPTPPAALLTDEQRHALADLDQAEAELKRLRYGAG